LEKLTIKQDIFTYLGKRLTSYYNGFFGEDYDDKIIEAIGKNWIVVRIGGKTRYADFKNDKIMLKYLKRWCNDSTRYKNKDI